MHNAVHGMCAVEAPSLWTSDINLFKKQKVISIPLDQAEVRVLHPWNPYKPLQRAPALRGKSTEKLCKPMSDSVQSCSSSSSDQRQFFTWVSTTKSSHWKQRLIKIKRKDTTRGSHGGVSVGERLVTLCSRLLSRTGSSQMPFTVQAGTTSMQQMCHGRQTLGRPAVVWRRADAWLTSPTVYQHISETKMHLQTPPRWREV